MSKKRTEESASAEQFRALEIQRRYRFFRSPMPGNLFIGILTEAYMATGEEIFLDAMETGFLYGFNDGQALRKIRQVGTLRASGRVVATVDAELRRQQEAKERRSLRKAYERAAVETGVEAPTLEAARKRVESTYKASASGTIPNGDTGGEVLVGKCEITETPEGIRVSGNAEWYPDNSETRRMVAQGGYVVFDRKYRDHAHAAQYERTMSLSSAARLRAMQRYGLRHLPSDQFKAALTPEGQAYAIFAASIVLEAALDSSQPGWKDHVSSEILAQFELRKELARRRWIEKGGSRGPLWRARRRTKVETEPTLPGTKG